MILAQPAGVPNVDYTAQIEEININLENINNTIAQVGAVPVGSTGEELVVALTGLVFVIIIINIINNYIKLKYLNNK